MSDGLAWVFRGPLANGQFQVMDQADIDKAVTEGWAQDVAKTGHGLTPADCFKRIEPGPHAAAEAYAARRRDVGYPTRELKPGPAPAPEPAKQAEAADEAEEEPAKARKPAPKPTPKRK